MNIIFQYKVKKSRSWLPGAGGGERGGLLLNGYRVSVWKIKRVLEMDGGGGFTTMSMYLMSSNCTLKNS